MKKIWSTYNKMKLGTKICLLTGFIFIMAIILVSVCLSIVFMNIKNSQQQLPSDFFDFYNKITLAEISQSSKQLIWVLFQSRNSFMTLIRNIISTQKFAKNLKLNPNKTITGIAESNIDCLKSKPNNSMFNCQMDIYTNFVISQAWSYLNSVKFKRFSLYYQSKEDQNDIMIKTASEVDVITDVKLHIVKKRMSQQRNGVITFSHFYEDDQGLTKDSILAFRTKVVLPTYTVLIELESYGGCLTSAVSRLFYSDNANIVVLSHSQQNSKGYQYISSYKELHPLLDFSKLLEPGYQTVQFGRQKIFCYTVTLSSAYKLGSTHDNKQYENEDYVLVMYSVSVSLQMEHIIDNFINKMFYNIQKFY